MDWDFSKVDFEELKRKYETLGSTVQERTDEKVALILSLYNRPQEKHNDHPRLVINGKVNYIVEDDSYDTGDSYGHTREVLSFPRSELEELVKEHILKYGERITRKIRAKRCREILEGRDYIGDEKTDQESGEVDIELSIERFHLVSGINFVTYSYWINGFPLLQIKKLEESSPTNNS